MSDRRFNLDLIDIPIPCAVPWESMQGSDRVRFCGQCRQHVFHLSMMSRAEAEELIPHGGRQDVRAVLSAARRHGDDS